MKIDKHIASLTLGLVFLASCSTIDAPVKPDPPTERTGYGWQLMDTTLRYENPEGAVVHALQTVASANRIDDTNRDAHEISTLAWNVKNGVVTIDDLSQFTLLSLPPQASLVSGEPQSHTTTRTIHGRQVLGTFFGRDLLVVSQDTIYTLTGLDSLAYRGRIIDVKDFRLIEGSDGLYAYRPNANGLWFSTDLGATWSDLSLPAGDRIRQLVGRNPFGDDSLRVFLADGSLKTLDEGYGWTAAHIYSVPNPVGIFVVGPKWDDIFVVDGDGAIWEFDHGTPVSRIAPVQPMKVSEIAWTVQGDVIAAADLGLFRLTSSHGSGFRWSKLTNMVGTNYTQVLPAAGDVVAISTDGVVARVYHGASGVTGHEYPFYGSAVTSATLFGNDPNDPNDPNDLYAISGEELYVDSISTNAAAGWTRIERSETDSSWARGSWVLLGHDSAAWFAGRVATSDGRAHDYTASVIDHVDELSVAGKPHKDVLVVRYSADPAMPVYTVYFQNGLGPIVIQTLQSGTTRELHIAPKE